MGHCCGLLSTLGASGRSYCVATLQLQSARQLCAVAGVPSRANTTKTSLSQLCRRVSGVVMLSHMLCCHSVSYYSWCNPDSTQLVCQYEGVHISLGQKSIKNSLTRCCVTVILLLHNCQCISALIMSQSMSYCHCHGRHHHHRHRHRTYP